MEFPRLAAEPMLAQQLAAFAEAIRAAPRCPGPRLVLADFLEEHGETDEAAALREAYQLAEKPVNQAPAEFAHLVADHVLSEFAGHLIARRTYETDAASGRRYGWRIYRLPGPRSRGGFAAPKPLQHYYETTEGRRERALAEWQASIRHAAYRRIKQAQAKRAARAEFVNPYQVGQLLYRSYGYDETHYEFAQVVAVGPRSVKVRRIAAHVVRETGWSSRIVGPAPGRFLDEPPATVTVQTRICMDGTPHHYLPDWRPVEGRAEFHDTAGSR